MNNTGEKIKHPKSENKKKTSKNLSKEQQKKHIIASPNKVISS